VRTSDCNRLDGTANRSELLISTNCFRDNNRANLPGLMFCTTLDERSTKLFLHSIVRRTLTQPLARECCSTKRKRWGGWGALALLAALVGCGQATPQERLQGGWISNSDASGCVAGANFENSTIVLQTICSLTDGTFGDEVMGGDFTATDSQIFVTFRKASCPATSINPTFSASYSFSGSSLVLSTTSGFVSLLRNNATGGGSASVAFGCFDATGGFARMPVTAF